MSKQYEKYKKYLNQKFAKLTIVGFELVPQDKKDGLNHNRVFAICDCDCGKKSCKKRLDGITGGKFVACDTYCSREYRGTLPSGNKNPAFKGVGKLNKTQYEDIKRCAVRRNLEFNITIEYIWNLFVEQNEKCKFSGQQLYFGPVRTPYTTASLDRIDRNLGYIEGNLQWVHKDINKMKGTLPDDEFIKICHMISKHRS